MKIAAAARMVGGAMMLVGAMIASGCSDGVSSPDAADDRTAGGIRVVGGGPELYTAIDQKWAEVEDCWGAAVSGGEQTVTIQQPEFYDNAGLGVIRFDGELVYGMRIGNRIWVAPDLAALRHEFSHVVGERATGHIVENGDGKCWL